MKVHVYNLKIIVFIVANYFCAYWTFKNGKQTNIVGVLSWWRGKNWKNTYYSNSKMEGIIFFIKIGVSLFTLICILFDKTQKV